MQSCDTLHTCTVSSLPLSPTLEPRPFIFNKAAIVSKILSSSHFLKTSKQINDKHYYYPCPRKDWRVSASYLPLENSHKKDHESPSPRKAADSFSVRLQRLQSQPKKEIHRKFYFLSPLSQRKVYFQVAQPLKEQYPHNCEGACQLTHHFSTHPPKPLSSQTGFWIFNQHLHADDLKKKKPKKKPHTQTKTQNQTNCPLLKSVARGYPLIAKNFQKIIYLNENRKMLVAACEVGEMSWSLSILFATKLTIYFSYNKPSSIKAAAFVTREISLYGWVQSMKTNLFLTLCMAKNIKIQNEKGFFWF